MMRVPSWALVQAGLLLFSASSIALDAPAAPPPSGLSLDQILARLQQHLADQSKQLESYDAIRQYRVEYKGYTTSISAAMTVEVHFDRSLGKSFRIVSESGSKLLCDRVLKKAVESEKEAARDPGSTALTAANYSFELIGSDALNGRPAYLLRVEPLQPSKFVYRGKVWVDAADYAVAKIDVEPARNPSVWISRSNIENTYAATDGMWLPQRNRSESRIRIGGTAVLTIDYGAYRVILASEH
jgi:hypothetical protein